MVLDHLQIAIDRYLSTKLPAYAVLNRTQSLMARESAKIVRFLNFLNVLMNLKSY